MHPTLLAVSHGTSDAAGASAIAELVALVDRALPDVDVQAAFVDVQQPDAADTVPAIEGPVVIVPLLLSSGFHVHHDLHGIAAKKTDAVVADPLGPDPRLADVLAERLAGVPGDGHPAASTSPVILAVAGSRDPRSLTDAEVMAHLLEQRLGRPIELAYLAARKPDLRTALIAHPDAPIATYLLARGFFFDLATRLAPGRALTLPLLDNGPVPSALVDLIVDRYEAAEANII